MVFGWGHSGSGCGTSQVAAGTAAAGGSDSATSTLAALVGDTSDVSWSPWPSVAELPRQPKQQQPFKVQVHDVKAHLQDRSTAVVDLRSVVDAPSDVLFDLLADPHKHEQIFDAIESATAELVSEEGSVRKWRLDYRARWKFWRVGGVCDNRLWMTTDRELGTVSFTLRDPGFLRKYEGTWTITGPDGKGPGGFCAAARPPAATNTVAVEGPATATSSSNRSSAEFPQPPWSPFTTFSQSGASDVTATPRSHALHHLSRSSSSNSGGLERSSSSSSSSNVSINDGGSIADAGSLATHGIRSPGPLTPRGGGVFGGFGGLATGLFAAVDNPFIAPPPLLAALRLPTATGGKDKELRGPAAAEVSPSPAVRPRFPTTIEIRKAISPKISPPYPLNQILKGHACGQVNDMLEGLLAATARKITEEEAKADGRGGVAARW